MPYSAALMGMPSSAIGTQLPDQDQTLHELSVVTNRSLRGDCAMQIFLSLAHEKSNYGNCSPGPGTAVHESGLGHSTLSRYR